MEYVANGFKWTVEITIAPNWVADGFEITEDRLLTMLGEALPHATEGEFAARVVRAPAKALIAGVQGY